MLEARGFQPIFLMIASVFPFRTILAQVLILFLAIAIESWFLQKMLKLGPRTSVEYTAILNLSCAVVGWLLFFGIESVLSRDLREQLIGYTILGGGQNIYPQLTLIGFLILAITFLAKWQALEIVENIAAGNKKASKPQFVGPPSLTRRPAKKTFQVSNQFGGILIAHTVSTSVILIVLFLQSIKSIN